MTNPLDRFAAAYEQAKAANADWPEACCIATADAGGIPSARMVLFRRIHPHGEQAGIGIFTNYDSAKAADLSANPHAAVCVYWHPIQTQVRIVGPVVKASAEESDEYFASRPRLSQVGAWASEQSRPLGSMDDLQARVESFERMYAGVEVPRPPHWGGFRIIARSVEFWTEGQYRLHKRERYDRREDGSWGMTLLNP